MVEEKTSGPHAAPKELDHGFGVRCVTKQVPLNGLQKWLKPAGLKATTIHADAMGEEDIAARMWSEVRKKDCLL